MPSNLFISINKNSTRKISIYFLILFRLIYYPFKRKFCTNRLNHVFRLNVHIPRVCDTPKHIELAFGVGITRGGQLLRIKRDPDPLGKGYLSSEVGCWMRKFPAFATAVDSEGKK